MPLTRIRISVRIVILLGQGRVNLGPQPAVMVRKPLSTA
jgi:hypothetical protein